MEKEATARIIINRLLEESGWRFGDSDAGRQNILLEQKVDLEDGKIGLIDYLLVDEKQFPICVIEAKNKSIDPLSGKEQARNYAKGTESCPFVILSNGASHYLWDVKEGNPKRISEFPTQSSLQERADYKPHPQELAEEKVTADYIKIKNHPLRDYQVAAIHAVQQAAKEGKKRFLLEMATGTGKTAIAAALCQLFINTGQATRILFLVDRIELETQADNNFCEIFKDIYTIRKYKGGNWRAGKIVISTVQSLMANDRYRRFKSRDFDLIISDEAHRSLSGKSRAVFEHFLGYKIGLTATPKDFFRGTDDKTMTQAESEWRNMADTYIAFDCENGEPTFRYDLDAGVKSGVLISPYVLDARTHITKELLDEGYSVTIENDNDDDDEVAIFNAKDFERKYFSENTNRVLCETILQNGMKDPITGELGKTLVFCVSRSHAARIEKIFNECASKLGYSDSNFAVQITSDVTNAQEYAKKFAGNNLSGKSKYAKEKYPNYDTCKTRVCVTVGMMTTGYDCPDLLNIAFLRPIYSPSSFIQMKGRGTRTHIFRCQEENGNEIRKEKKEFFILDFFANHEYFQKGFKYDEKIPPPKTEDKSGDDNDGRGGGDDGNFMPAIDRSGAFHDKAQDSISTITYIKIGKEGMRVDRATSRHQLFEEIIRNSETIQQIHENKELKDVLDFIESHVLNQPDTKLTIEGIRQSYTRHYDINRKIGLTEMVKMALQTISQFKTRNERIDEEFARFCDNQKLNISPDQKEQTDKLKIFFETYLSDSGFREIIDSERFALLDGYQPFSINDLRQIGNLRKDTIKYINKHLQIEFTEFDWQSAAA